MAKLLHKSLEDKLSGLNDKEWDSSDDENETDNESMDVDDEPQKDKATSTQNQPKSKPKKKQKQVISSVIYLGHLPPNFEEAEMLSFFSQFGTVAQVKLSRSKKTNRPRGYAFVQFAEENVAPTVAETMSGYLLLGRRVVCHVVPSDKIHVDLFTNSKKGKHVFKKKDWQRQNRLRVNDPKRNTSEVLGKITKGLLKREHLKREKMIAMGMDYNFPGFKAAVEAIKVEAKDDKEVTGEKVIHGKKKLETKRKRKQSIDESSGKENPNHVAAAATINTTAETTKDAAPTTPAKKDKKKAKKTKTVVINEKAQVVSEVKEAESSKSVTRSTRKGKRKEIEPETKDNLKDEASEAMEKVLTTPKADTKKTPKSKKKSAGTPATNDDQTKQVVAVSKRTRSGKTPQKGTEPKPEEDEQKNDVAPVTPKAKKASKSKTPKSKKKKVTLENDEEVVPTNEKAVIKTPKSKKKPLKKPNEEVIAADHMDTTVDTTTPEKSEGKSGAKTTAKKRKAKKTKKARNST